MLPMIHWQIELFYGYLLIQFWWSKHWGYSFSCEMVVEWQSNPYCIFCHSNGCKKVKKAHYWPIEPLSKFEFGGGETAFFESLPREEGVNSRKISVRWGRFRFYVNIRVCNGHQFCCFLIIYVIIKYQICYNHIYLISIGILIYENLGLCYDTFTEIKCEISGHLGFLNVFRPFTRTMVCHAV